MASNTSGVVEARIQHEQHMWCSCYHILVSNMWPYSDKVYDSNHVPCGIYGKFGYVLPLKFFFCSMEHHLG